LEYSDFSLWGQVWEEFSQRRGGAEDAKGRREEEEFNTEVRGVHTEFHGVKKREEGRTKYCLPPPIRAIVTK